MLEKNIFVSDEMILCKVSQLLNHFNSGMPENQRVNLTFSNEWLYRFKERNGFKQYYCFGESADLEVRNIVNDLPFIINELKK